MHIAIVHYHLNRGGVTQVIVNHLRSLDSVASNEPLKILLLYGGRREGWPDDLVEKLTNLEIAFAIVPELDYDQGTHPAPERLAEAMRERLARHGLSADNTILHVHNHSLGKNVSLPVALARLAPGGWRLLLQIHDFAEDFRPEQYGRLRRALSADVPAGLPEILYPQAEQIHYAVLNGRDRQVLLDAGVAAERVHFLPNPVADVGTLVSRAAARRKLHARFKIPVERRLVLYPVRGIRRKNLGELLLWSAANGADATFGLTLPPLNPIEQPSYQSWKEFAADRGLPCVFELGADDGLTFQENLAAADAILTTSVAEGFGMVFLESWLAGRPLVGRDLPEITSDFVESGVAFPWLSSRLRVPLDWFGAGEVRVSLRRHYEQSMIEFGRPKPSDEEFSAAFDSLVEAGTIDFVFLDSGSQRRIIDRVREDAAARELLLAENAALTALQSLDPAASLAVIEKNAAAVRKGYAPEVCGHRLRALYDRVAASLPADALVGPPNGQRILDSFLSLERFRPIRVEP